MTQKQSVSPWVITPAIRDPIRLPPNIRGVAHVVAFIRGLLLDDRLTVRDDYWALVDLLRPEIQAIKGEAEAVVSPGWIDKAKARNGRLFVFRGRTYPQKSIWGSCSASMNKTLGVSSTQ